MQKNFILILTFMNHAQFSPNYHFIDWTVLNHYPIKLIILPSPSDSENCILTVRQMYQTHLPDFN